MTAVYLYDASDRCIMSQVNGYATYFVPEGDRVLQEVDGNSAQVTKEYVWGSAIDELVILQLDGEIYHAHADALGSTSLLTDANGDIVERYDYNPFGACVATDVNGGGLVGNPYWFTGRRLNSETGLYYYSARHYTTEMGRFLSPDPIGPRGDETNWGNAYAYGGNNPFSGWDPTGMGWFRDTFNSVRDFGAGLVGGAVESVTFGFVESSTVGNALGADTASVSYKAGSLTGAIGTGIALNVATSGIFGAADATVSLTRGAIQVGVGIANGSTESVLSGLTSIGMELLPGAMPSGSSAGRGLADVSDDAGSTIRNASGSGTKIEPPVANRNKFGSKGKPDHQDKVSELGDKARSEAKSGEKVLREKRIQGHDSRRIPDQQIVNESGKTRKVFEAERHPNRKRNKEREQEYDDLGIEYETHGLGG